MQPGSLSRDTPDSFGFMGYILWAPEPLPSDSSLDVLCPFMGLLVYGHRPFHLCPRAVVAVLLERPRIQESRPIDPIVGQTNLGWIRLKDIYSIWPLD